MKFPKIKFKPNRFSGKITFPRESVVNQTLRLQRANRKRRKTEEEAEPDTSTDSTTSQFLILGVI